MELLLEDFRENLHAEKSSVSRSSGSCLESVMSMKTSAKSLELGSNAAEGPSIKFSTRKISMSKAPTASRVHLLSSFCLNGYTSRFYPHIYRC